ncbi:MAG: dihydrofolate reductase [Prevotellaceae bacterium]|jgi:dihydrofolate reductase|nr:dihydrofolate reductase [Prevotellaceae bacterium]
MISIIVAVAQNLAIGKNNNLLCPIPGDLKRFKEITDGHTVIMGRKTWESLPNKPLPNRKNIVLSTQIDFVAEGALTVRTLDEAITLAKSDDEVFIIGGGQLYKQALPLADKLYLTWIKYDFTDADTFFPEIDFGQWHETFREDISPSEKCPYSYSFVDYEHKKTTGK